jgi:hypothetical protein
MRAENVPEESRMSHQVEYLQAAIIDLRTNLEAKLRHVMAIEVYLEIIGGDDPDAMQVQQVAKYIDAVKTLNTVSGALVQAVDGALATVVIG